MTKIQSLENDIDDDIDTDKHLMHVLLHNYTIQYNYATKYGANTMKKLELLIDTCLDCPKCKLEPHVVSYKDTYYCLDTGKGIPSLKKFRVGVH